MAGAVFDVTYPRRFDRVQVVLRVVIIWLAALIGIPFWLILYLGFPVLAAVLKPCGGRCERPAVKALLSSL